MQRDKEEEGGEVCTKSIEWRGIAPLPSAMSSSAIGKAMDDLTLTVCDTVGRVPNTVNAPAQQCSATNARDVAVSETLAPVHTPQQVHLRCCQRHHLWSCCQVWRSQPSQRWAGAGRARRTRWQPLQPETSLQYQPRYQFRLCHSLACKSELRG